MSGGPWVVAMRDRALSGWGRAIHRQNIFCVVCDTPEQVEAVRLAARERPEMSRVRVLHRVPPDNAGQLVSARAFGELGGKWLAHYRPRQ